MKRNWSLINRITPFFSSFFRSPLETQGCHLQYLKQSCNFKILTFGLPARHLFTSRIVCPRACQQSLDLSKGFSRRRGLVTSRRGQIQILVFVSSHLSLHLSESPRSLQFGVLVSPSSAFVTPSS